jgi:hypothetical protein
MSAYNDNLNSKSREDENDIQEELVSARKALLDRGMAMVQSQGDKLSARLYRIGDQFKECSEIFYRNEEEFLGDGFKKFGTSLKKMSHTYQRSDLDDFVDKAKTYAKRNPEIVAFGLCLGAIGLTNYFRSPQRQVMKRQESFQEPDKTSTYGSSYLEEAEAEPGSDTRQVI